MHSFPVSSEAFHRSSPGRRSIHIHRPGLGRTLWLEIPDVVSDWLMEANWWSGRQNIQLQKWAEKLDGFEIEGASNVEIFCTGVASMLPMSSTSICHVGQHMAAKSIAFEYGEASGTGSSVWEYFPCGMGVVDSIFPRSYTWFCQLHAGWTSRSTHLTSLSDLGFYWLVVQSRCLPMWKNSLIAESVKERVLLDLIGSLLGKLCGRMQLCLPRNDATAQYGDREEFCHCSLRSL